MSIPTFESDKVHITLLDNSIFRVLVKENVQLELHDLDANYFFFKENIPSEKVSFLIVYQKGSALVKRLTDKFKENGPINTTHKEALVIPQFWARITSKLYTHFSKPNHPTKVFSSEGDALNWLKK